MTCELIREEIDKLIFEKDEKVFEEVSRHIESCNSCKSYFEENIPAKNVIRLLQEEPDLRDSKDLTNSILAAIDNIEQIPESKKNNSNPKIIQIIRMSLAAASISLLIVFGIEQYILFDKISKMEEYVSNISIEYKNANFNIELKNGNLYNLLHYNLGFQPETFNNLFTKDINSPGHSKLKARLIRTRLSAIANNEIDNQRINQIMQELSTKSGLDLKVN